MLALGLSACAAKRQAELDTPFSDAVTIEAAAPEQVLEAGVASEDPAVRGRALAWRVRAAPSAELGRWVMQGSYDPDPWVQSLVVEAMLTRLHEPVVREALLGLCTRGATDPLVRAEAARRWLAQGDPAALEALKTGWELGPLSRVGPLALVALRLGVTEAQAGVEAALRRGALGEQVGLLVWAAQGADPGVVAAFEEGAARAEESTALRYAFALGVAGLSAGGAPWTAALRDPDADLQRDALELVTALPAPERVTWARRASQAADPGVREAAAVLARPGADHLGRALRSSDDFVREIASGALSELAVEAATPLLRVALVDEASVVRLRAAEAAGRLGARGVEGQLAALLTDEREEVRVAAAGALWSMSAR